jgi:hypothetical protein
LNPISCQGISSSLKSGAQPKMFSQNDRKIKMDQIFDQLIFRYF